MNPLRAVLIDDEQPARQRLTRLLQAHRDVIEVAGDASDARSGLVLLRETRPDLLFLDIQMPGMTGLDLLGQLHPRPHVVFVTAYAEYAVRAFEENALDYLLKPVEPARLAQAVARLRTRLREADPLSPTVLEALAARLQPPQAVTSIPVKSGDRFFFVPIESVTHFEARDKYVYLHTDDGSSHLLEQSLAALAKKLPDTFVQVHRSVVVNRTKIREVHRFFNNRYVLHLGERPRVKITTGPSYAEVIREALTL